MYLPETCKLNSDNTIATGIEENVIKMKRLSIAVSLH